MHFTYKNSLLILGAILLVGGAFVLAEYRNKKAAQIVYVAPSTATVESLSSELQNIDADEDGLKDWEEVLLGTDPDKADSDGDGTSDGKEAAGGRNPLVKGPGDAAADPAKTAAAAQNLTATEKFARDFFARYVELNQIGLSGDKTSQAELVGEVLKNGLVLSVPKLLTEKDILIKADASLEAKKIYGNQVGAVFAQNKIVGKDETVIAKESFEQEDLEVLKQIDPIIATYKRIVAGLLKISAPADAAPIHLSLVNAVTRFLFVAESLRQVETDAVKGIQAVREQPGAAVALSNSFQELRKYLLAAGIRYESLEAGNMFTAQ